MRKIRDHKETRSQRLKAQGHPQAVAENQPQHKEAHRSTDQESVKPQCQKGVQCEWQQNNEHLCSLVSIVPCNIDAEIEAGEERDPDEDDQKLERQFVWDDIGQGY